MVDADRRRLEQDLSNLQPQWDDRPTQAAADTLLNVLFGWLQSKYNEIQQLTARMDETRLQPEDLSGSDNEEESMSSIYKQKYERAIRDLDSTKRRLQQQHEEEMEQQFMMKKATDKKLCEALEDLDEERKVASQWKRKAQKLTSEMQDLRLSLEEQMVRNAELEKRQRKFDSELVASQEELRKEVAARERLEREREAYAGVKYSLEQELQVTQLKRGRQEVERKLAEAEEELEEQAGQVTMLEQAKLRLEMTLEKCRQEFRRDLANKEDEIDDLRATYMKKMKNMEAQLEAEQEERHQLARQRHELERRISELQEALASRQQSAGNRETVQRLRRDLKCTRALLADAQLMLERSRSGDPASKTLIRQLRNQVEDAEMARSAALKSRQGTQQELEELQAQLEDISRTKQEAESPSDSASTGEDQPSLPAGGGRGGAGCLDQQTPAPSYSSSVLDLQRPTNVVFVCVVSSIYKQKYERAIRDLDSTKRRLQQQHEEEMEQQFMMKKATDKKLCEALEDLDEERKVASQWKRKAQKLTSEMQDLRLSLEEQMVRNAELEKRQRKFDSELVASQEELRKEVAARKGWKGRGRPMQGVKYSLEQELQVTQLKRGRQEVERKLAEAEEELEEQAGQVTMLEQAKLRLEMTLEKCRQEFRRDLANKEDEIDDLRATYMKKMKNMEAQLEAEQEERHQLARQRHELERRISELQEALASRQQSAGNRETVQRLRRDLKCTRALLADAQLMLERSRSGDPASKTLIRQLRNQVEDAEMARSAALKSRQGTQQELEELQAQLEDISRTKQEAECRVTQLARERTSLLSQLEEAEEELVALTNKHRAVLQQLSLWLRLAVQAQITKLKEQGERSREESEACRAREQAAKDVVRHLQRQLREAKEELAIALGKETEYQHKLQQLYSWYRP
ncbi:MYO18B [Cordylochernes scorpioides]|uniref:MYO18B n=1 Tax=Cordylochernes scorpioides TaxID=51811 RepID=A0ABY6LD05_9ARAC|nr:MYO18B [Cordylochernes scorpioides]